MKTFKILIFIFCVHITTNICGQVSIVISDSVAQKLKGTWFLINKAGQDSLVYSRQSSAPNNWGLRIEIYENGEFVEASSTKCGNDPSIHKNNGSWSLERNGIIINTTIPMYHSTMKHKILKLTADTLVVLKL